MTIIHYEEDATLNDLAGRSIGVFGYGPIGRPVALNLRDSGLSVLVSGDAEEQIAAAAEGFAIATFTNLAQTADVLMLMLPDEMLPDVYINHISAHLTRGDTLIFSSAYNVAFGFIEAPPFVDVALISPRTIGGTLRERYISGEGTHSFVAVAQDASGSAWNTVLAAALALGSLRAGAVEIRFEQEAEISLFIQQALIPAFHNMVITAAHLLSKVGYPPEAFLTDLYLSGKFTDYALQAAQSGMLHALEQTTRTGQYGALSRLNRFSEIKLERLMEITLDEIRRGDFAREWSREVADGMPRLNRMIQQQGGMDIWELEQQTLDLLRRYTENTR
jgi:ketol-acid reductoisomerase